MAPSPTGAQHLGNARTHLIAFWAARQAGGRLALRIDDLDSPRVKQWASDQAIADLQWLGITWDSGPVFQSQTTDQYARVLRELIDMGRAYPCTCSRKEIEQALSAPHEGQAEVASDSNARFRGEGIIYPGTCSRWTLGDPEPTEPHCWRFRATEDVISFQDRVLGTLKCSPARELGDFPITQKNSNASYQLAVVVDDSLAGVTEIVRGNDLVASTFRQLDLIQALNWSRPTYAHVPLIRGEDNRRLAKRHGDTRLSYYRDRGISASQIVGWAARSLGMAEQGSQHQAADLIGQLEWANVGDQDLVINTQTLFY